MKAWLLAATCALLPGCGWIAGFSSTAGTPDGAVDVPALEASADGPADVAVDAACTWAAPVAVRSCLAHADGVSRCIEVTGGGSEPRAPGVRQLVVELAGPLPAASPAVAVSCTRPYGGEVLLEAPAGAMTVELQLTEPLPDADCCRFAIRGAACQGSADVLFRVRALVGDGARPGDGVVDVEDLNACAFDAGAHPADEGNFWCDLDMSGMVDGLDFGLWQERNSRRVHPCLLAVDSVRSCRSGAGGETCAELYPTGTEPRLGGIAELRIALAAGLQHVFGDLPGKTDTVVSCSDDSETTAVLRADAAGGLTVEFDPPIADGACCEVVVMHRPSGLGLRFWARALLGDVDGDGVVGAEDEQLMGAAFNDPANPVHCDGLCDLGGSEGVDMQDFLLLTQAFGGAVDRCRLQVAHVSSCLPHDPAGTPRCLDVDGLRPEPRVPGLRRLRWRFAWAADAERLAGANSTGFCLQGVPISSPVGAPLSSPEPGVLEQAFEPGALPANHCCVGQLLAEQWWAAWVVARSLVGDIDGSGAVDGGDVVAFDDCSPPLEPANAHCDVNVNGVLDDRTLIEGEDGALASACVPHAAHVWSCREHGAAGQLCIELTGDLASEPRQGGGELLKVELNGLLPRRLLPRAAALSCQGGAVHPLAFDRGAWQLILAASGLPDDGRCCVLWRAATGRSLGLREAFHNMAGDVVSSSDVDAADLLPYVEIAPPVAVDPSNVRLDVMADGWITGADEQLVVSRQDSSRTACPASIP